MKKLLSLLLLALTLGGCSVPNSLQLDLYQGFGQNMKLLHLNASNHKNRQRIEEFASIVEGAEPLEKDIGLFAYYPDYILEITQNGRKESIVLDINGEFLDFYYPDQQVVYRSSMAVADFKKLLHKLATR